MLMEERDESRRLMALELEQAHYEAPVAELGYAACDPDSRSIAPRLEKRPGSLRCSVWRRSRRA